MKELGNPNDTLEQRLERHRLTDPDLSLLDTDDEDDFLNVTNDDTDFDF